MRNWTPPDDEQLDREIAALPPSPGYISHGKRGILPRISYPPGEYTMSKKELEAAALNLPVEERASLAHKLIASIDDAPTDGIEEAWISEADRRAEQVIRGEVQTVAGHEVFEKAYKRRRQK